MLGIASNVALSIARAVSPGGSAGHGTSGGQGALAEIGAHWPWLVVALGFVGAIFKDELKKWISAAIDRVATAVYDRFASSRLLHRVAIRKYLASVSERNAELQVPFRPDKPLRLDEVYVPLEFQTYAPPELLASDKKRAGKLVDAPAMLAEHKRVLVLGDPGAGKSIFLKSLVAQYAQVTGRHLPACLPVLLELHRLAPPDGTMTPIEQGLAGYFKDHEFPATTGFIERALNDGNLMLLFDGLDEVPSARRLELAKAIDDFLRKYPRCPAVVTCRVAAFRPEYVTQARVTLNVAEFTDQLIQRFLSQWPGISGLPSVAEFMRVLHERPRMLVLARNPLLLTMLAYLYTDLYGEDSSQLPRSRADFYKQATDALLSRWHGEHNSFRKSKDERDKRRVLQRLALTGLGQSAEASSDWVTIVSDRVTADTKDVLTHAGRPEDDADPLLEEIVERSGLLLEIDGGERFKFPHLTLQEYFAASELVTRPDDLLRCYDADTDRWRETVRLWCGVASDCTHVVTAVYAREPVLALECIADAERVEQATVDLVVGHFLEVLADPLDDRVTRALSEVATSEARGPQVLADLKSALDRPGGQKMAAARVLAATHLSEVPGLLLDRLGESSEVLALLTGMGDAAVPGIADRMRAGSGWAAAALGTIGTPLAIRELVTGLWADGPGPTVAAWCLGGLIPHPLTIDVLAQQSWDALPAGAKSLPRFDWVWMPFADEGKRSSPVTAIVGRTAYLISRAEAVPEAGDRLDPRIAAAILLVKDAGFYDQLKSLTGSQARIMESRIEPDSREDFSLKHLAASARSKNLLGALPLGLQYSVVETLQGYGRPTERQWEAMREAGYDEDSNRITRTLRAVYAVFVLAAGVCAGGLIWRADAAWEIALTGIAITSLILGVTSVFTATKDFEDFTWLAFDGPVGVLLWLDTYGFPGKADTYGFSEQAGAITLTAVLGAGSSTSVILLVSFALGAIIHLAWWQIAVAWLPVAAFIVAGVLLNSNLYFRDLNPLRGSLARRLTEAG